MTTKKNETEGYSPTLYANTSDKEVVKVNCKILKEPGNTTTLFSTEIHKKS